MTPMKCCAATSVVEMTRWNSCCHDPHVRVRCRGSRGRGGEDGPANALADRALMREGSPYPDGNLENTGHFNWPTDWPVWSPVVATRKRLISFLVLLIASACRQAPAPAMTSQP